jgi:colanic acid biosynthesis glycosyl transferase WcaI
MNTGLRILVLGMNYDPEPTGIAPYTAGIARFLAEAGHDAHVVSAYPHYPSWRVADGYTGLRTRERIDGVPVTRVRHPIPGNPTGTARILSEAAFAAHAALVRFPAPDVIIAVSPALLTVAAALIRRLGRNRPALGVVVQDLYGRAVGEAGVLGGRGERVVSAVERALLTRADEVVAIHDTFERSLVDIGVARDRISVIRNWTHSGPPQGDPEALRTSLGWERGEIVALHAGNMGAKQGLENVVHAAQAADLSDARVRFVLLGDGSQRPELERLGAGVRRLQFVDPLPSTEFSTALAAADVLVLNERPGVAEMCVPSKLTSYFAAGRPVVAATGADGAAAIELRAARAGRRVEPGDPGALLSGVVEVGRNRVAARTTGDHGQRYAREVLSADAARAAYVAWIDRLHSVHHRRNR